MTESYRPPGVQGLNYRAESSQRPIAPPTAASYEDHQAQNMLPAFGSSSSSRPQYSNQHAPYRPTNSVLSSLIPSRQAHASPQSKSSSSKSMSYAAYIKSATPGAFASPSNPSPFKQPKPISGAGSSSVYSNSHAEWTRPKQEGNGEAFDLNAANITVADTSYFNKDAEKEMRELLSGAIGEGEDDEGEQAMETVHGLAEGVSLMPHQQKGARWLKKREAASNYGGILADDMGLGKTVQMIARICERRANAAELKAGYAGTLVVAPLAVMEQWASEIRTKTMKGHVKVTTHHGPSRVKDARILQKYDVVITTFQTLASEHGAFVPKTPIADSASSSDEDSFQVVKRATNKKKPASPLFDMKWLRVVIDEAQNIKNHNTKAAKAATAVKAKYRWCLTGTPIQNKVEELYSLFKFLDIRPLNNWDTFKRQIVTPIKSGQTKVAMKRLHVVLNSVMLRRTKDATINGKAILNLPGRTVNVVDCPFDDSERSFYQAVEKKMDAKLQKLVAEGAATSYTSVLTLLLRLRQACLHPVLLKDKILLDIDDIDPAEPIDLTESDDEDDDLAKLLGGLAVGEKASTSPTNDETTPKEKPLAPSAKIRQLLDLLDGISKRGERTIVFSQFTSFLDLLGPFLKSNGISFVRYDGSMRNDKRQESLEKIKSDPKITVILISFKSGSVGLNLTACNNVILMDLWWNPALEDQAFDRAHRLGQKLDVNIYKLTVSGTVEDRILALQDTKRELARAALSGEGAKNVHKLGMNELLGLFRSTYHKPDDDD